MTDQEKTEFKIAKDIISDVGMTVNMFNSFNFNVIHDYGVRFAYVITRPKYGDVANVKQLEWKYDAKGYLKELKDTEYDLELYNHRLQLKPTADLGIVKVSIIT
jgi:hypothetical protein